MNKLFSTFIILLISQTLTSQVSFDFENNDLSAWAGTISDYIINENNQLQLNAPEAGNSFIYIENEFPDSLIWTFDVIMDFAPSTSNKLEIWLAYDNINIDNANGYFLNLGSSGSEDAIQLYKQVEGNATLQAEGTMGLIAAGTALTITATKNLNDLWTLSVKPIDALIQEVEFEVVIEDENLDQYNYFGFNCIYTSTRTDKFFFDNIYIGPEQIDTIAPQVSSVVILNDLEVEICFSELIDPKSFENFMDNFSISPTVEISNVELSDASANCLHILFNPSLPKSTNIELVIKNISDFQNNIMAEYSTSFIIAEAPQANEILINEILYHPLSGNASDYVELINNTNKVLKIDSLLFARANSTIKPIQLTSSELIYPNEIIAFTADIAEIIETYLPPDTANIVNQAIPNYVQDEGNVWIRYISDGDTITIDSFDYFDDLHSELIANSNVDGVSLERISFISDTNDSNNWFSAASSVNYGTPGYSNSQRSQAVATDEVITLENKTFSPNGDGFKDFVKINYDLETSGYQAKVAIYDDNGKFETYIAQNELISQQGFFTWDGTLEDGTLAKIGMYIIYYDIFNTTGDVISGKKVCVLAKQL